MPFEKGHKKLGGWAPESKEKHRRAAEVFYKIYNGIGGDEAFIEWASKEENRGKFYKMYAKQLPTEVAMSGSEDDATPINIYMPAIAAKL
ncbi:hypothetical protein AGMMS49921_02080 [Endomicrobiia bacterium]|nr:hypothetical protein AGMMS49593_02320 [Endomicrobiia bacterium]GHT40530.1 hypothetical protein AGMMS49921_02080 [Endomicrobiia bacterium]